MTVLITLTTAGIDSGPFDLYSNLNGYLSVFESGVDKTSLEAGYTSTNVPDYTTIIRCMSTGFCTNFIDIPVDLPPTTSTSTSTSTSTTTSTSTSTSSTTTTTTTINCSFTGSVNQV
jgi:hypothetical protein